eukprot:TRINITY_DN4598_c0_g1_i1.p1 TRINITY_DN4598_c0_g1~~TRINITY_DN4598_c0_g1_i1.p1  ORF type:complete len:634 (+),score=164.54 TRINITY_DN4598_c0_g1_i1:209-2110(+)
MSEESDTSSTSSSSSSFQEESIKEESPITTSNDPTQTAAEAKLPNAVDEPDVTTPKREMMASESRSPLMSHTEEKESSESSETAIDMPTESTSEKKEDETKKEEGETKTEENKGEEVLLSRWNRPYAESPIGMTLKEIVLVMIGLMLALFLAALDSTIVATALPEIVTIFDGLDLYSWPIIAYLLTSTTVIPLVGRLSDIFGRKIMYQIMVVIFLIGSAICGAATNMEMLIVFRAFQGIGGGAIVALCQVIIGDIVSVRARGKFAGLFGATFALSSVLGPTIGGLLTDHASWRWVFYINLPIGVVAVVLSQFFLRIPGDKIKLEKRLFKKVDYLGIFLLVSGVILVLLGVSFGGNEYEWNSAAVICFFVIGGLLIVFFVPWEKRFKYPIIRVQLFLKKDIGLSNVISFLFGWCMFGSISYLPLYFQIVKGDSPTISGLKTIPLMIGLVGVSMASGITISKTGHYYSFPLLGSMLLILSFSLIGSLLTVTLNYWLLAFFMFLMGCGIGSVLQTLVIICQSKVEVKEMASTTATVSFLRTMGGSVGVAVCGAVLNNQLIAKVTTPQMLVLLNRGHDAVVHGLSEELAKQAFEDYTSALRIMFLACIPAGGIALFLALFITRAKIARAQHIETPLE